MSDSKAVLIRNFPNDLYSTIEKRADNNFRSVPREILYLLEVALKCIQESKDKSS